MGAGIDPTAGPIDFSQSIPAPPAKSGVEAVVGWLVDAVRGTSIRTSLYLLFGLCAVVMGGQSGLALIDAWKQVTATADIERIAITNRELFIALQSSLAERGPLFIALEAVDPADPKLIAQFAEARAKAGPAIEALVSACGAFRCADGDVAGTLRRLLAATVAVRQKADSAIQQPLAARPAGLAKEWFASALALGNELERISTALTDKIRMADPQIAELVGIKEAAWITRAVGGTERTIIQQIRAARAYPVEAREKRAALGGQAEAAWRIVKMLSARPGVPAPVVEAVTSAQNSLFDVYAKTRSDIEKAASEGRESPLSDLQLMAAANSALDQVVAVCNVALDEIIAYAQRQSVAARGRLALYGGGLVLALAIGVTGFLFAWRRLAGPISLMSLAMLRMAEGDISADMPNQGRRDEIGDVARAAQILRQSLVRMREMEAEQRDAETRLAAERQAAQEREAAQQKAAEAKSAAERKAAVAALADRFEAAVGEVIDTVSSAATELQASANTLTQTAEATQRMSGSVAAASEQASANVRSVAGASEQMSRSISQISRQVVDSRTIAGEAVAQAQRTDARIAELSQAASRIGDVVKMITAIAEQTNLLALNATIEAARAGVAGKGFAVVAQEVKALASQTAKATEDIGRQIADMQAATGESVAAIKEIGATIARVSEIASGIAAAMEEQGAATGEIARNVQQAAKGTAEVAANITDVNRGAAETGSASAQVLTSAQSLAGESHHLKQEVERFLATVRAA